MESKFRVTRGHGSAPAHQLSRQEAEQLIKQFGETADLVAAQLADSFFLAGDHEAGTRWTKIFRAIAESHLHCRTMHPPASVLAYQ
jgi:hypothetical protein